MEKKSTSTKNTNTILDTVSRGSYSKSSILSLGEAVEKPPEKPLLPGLMKPKSYSYLKLEILAEGREWEEYLDDFNLEELRDEFFDTVYTKPEHVIDCSNDSESGGNTIVEKIKKETKSSTMLSDLYYKCLPPPSQLWIDFLDNKVSIFKFFIAYFIAMVICVIRPSGTWLGHRYRYFMPLAVLIHHPVRNITVQLEMTLFSTLGGSFGMAWSALAWYVSTATRLAANNQGGLLFTSLVVALLFSTWISSYFQRLLYFSKSFSIAIIFLHTVETVNSMHDLHWKLFWDFGLSYLFGMLLSLLVCVIVFPRSGNKELMMSFRRCIDDTKGFLVCLVDANVIGDDNKINIAQKCMASSLNIGLSESYREFSNQVTINKFNSKNLEELRNSLTRFINPLRILPTQSNLLDKENITNLYESLKNIATRADRNSTSGKNNSGSATPMLFSGVGTPQPHNEYGINLETPINSQIYTQILRNSFSTEIFGLLSEMISMLENLSMTINAYEKRNGSIELQEMRDVLQYSEKRLKRKIYKLDVAYKEFTRTDYYSENLLTDPDAVNIFLFLRSLRNASKHLLEVSDSCITLGGDISWRITPFHYPLHRALHRLPKQCSIDEGAGNVLNYFETKRDVDDIFEKLYHAYTSRHQYNKSPEAELKGSIRAVDHEDFNFHSTSNPWRLKIWKISTLLVGDEMKWSMKKAFVMVFLCLPAWLSGSYRWYQEYQCWWAPMAFYLLSHRKYSGNWARLARRLLFCLIGIFWGWAANQSRHFGSPYIVCTFSGILVVPIALNIFAYKNTRSSFTTMMCFSVIALEPYSKASSSMNTALIWKNTWVTGLSFFIAVLISIPINWIVWSFKARSELRLSISNLLAHISQSYQSVADRYLYRDSNDAPTELTLALSHIREVRLSQSIEAIRALLEESKDEPIFVSGFKPDKYTQLIDLCEFLLERIIEARISGSNFEVWDHDVDIDITRALMSLRRDSVSAVIFVLYILSNCFRSKNKIPIYLPNPILSRKKLYEFINKFEKTKIPKQHYSNYLSSNNISIIDKKLVSNLNRDDKDSDEFEKANWTEIHRVTFERAFTDISDGLHQMVMISKEILDEEPY